MGGWGGRESQTVSEGAGEPGLQDALTVRRAGYRGELEIKSVEDRIQGVNAGGGGGGDTIDHVFLNDEKRP